MRSLAIASLALAVFLFLHTVIWRYGPRQGLRVGQLGLSALAAYLMTSFAFSFFASVAWAAHGWVSAPIFGLGATLYALLYGVLCRSVSLRMVEELVRSPGRSMSLEILKTQYSYTFMLGSRLSAMSASGLVQERHGRFALTVQGDRIARLMMRLKRLYHLRVSG